MFSANGGSRVQVGDALLMNAYARFAQFGRLSLVAGVDEISNFDLVADLQEIVSFADRL